MNQDLTDDLSQFYKCYTQLIEEVRELDLADDQRNMLIDTILNLHFRGFDKIKHFVVDDAVTITANLPYQQRAMIIETTIMLHKLGFDKLEYSIVDDTVTITASLPCRHRDNV